MENNNWSASPAQGSVPVQIMGDDAAALDAGDWRNDLPSDARKRITKKIMDTLKTHLPFSGEEGLGELKKVAVRFEEKIFTSATSQSDYLRKISIKMLAVEAKNQDPLVNSRQLSSASNNQYPQYPGSVPVQVMGGDALGVDAGDWRIEVSSDSRQRIANRIMDTLKRHLPFHGDEGLRELMKIAVRFEQKIFTSATSQSDYLRKISLKMIAFETKNWDPSINSLQSNAASNSQDPEDSDSHE